MAAPTLIELKKHLQLNTDTGDDDDEMQARLDAATGLVERLVGPLSPTEVTELHVVAGPTIVLEQPPVHEITSIGLSAATVPAEHYQLNKAAGIVRALGGRQFYGEYTVTYTAGWDTPPAELTTAVLIIAAQLWETQRVPGRRSSAFGQTDSPVPAGFAVPNRAAELMAPHLKGYLP